MSEHANMKTAPGKAKPPLALLPFTALTEVARAFADGLKKYELNDWRKGGPWRLYADAALRHIGAWMEGEDRAPDSGVHHLGHAAACMLILLYYALKGVGHDDRYPQGIPDQHGHTQGGGVHASSQSSDADSGRDDAPVEHGVGQDLESV